ncbi:uncharacterized protein PFL1_01860 [Pseudozyma flocculosa PF-1]|uniref:Zn(2)-C6 fungal-type domain-containing protein n=1 Tax=Pseudozyma flocculosa TaxID=84751 RepID=A0A5C3EYQ0_9BASI|nr:uncharacterized protein PFL1_01860 [Pseudozyma flocculosa PF-1]EPQ30334.1 hypothetical protein PFL1_01860 [Pseudozyma flocculosa PF-1]SPO37404.1 uncharacterized protein PSFLO_02877 [Pseudozyma flocculosa]
MPTSNAPHANGTAEPASAGSNQGSASPSSQSSGHPLRPAPSAGAMRQSPAATSTSGAGQITPLRTSSGTLITPKPLSARGPGTVADAVAASLGSKRERKRKRIHYSCAECHRRKHKCDRQTPCQPCIDRGLGDSCRPFEDGDQFGDMRDRVQRLEDIVEGLAVAQAELAKELSEARKGGFEYQEMESSGDENDGEQQTTADGQPRPKPRKKRRLIRPDTVRGMEREELYNSEAQAIAAVKGETIDSSSNQRPSSGRRYDEGGNPLEGGLARDGDSWFGALALPSVSRGVIETEINGERLELGANFPRFPASVKLHRLIHEGGAPENILSQLMNCLPSKQDTDRLLDIYFRDINHTRLPIHEGTFRQSYEELMEFRWGDAKEERGDDGARHVPFLAFLFSILATAMRSLPESMGTEAEAKKGAMRLYHACRRTINIASTIRVDHIDLVLAHLFAARFLICQRQSAESWSLLGTAIRAAQAIGLHRDGSKLGLDAITTERRRRLWALIFHMDKTTSILLGRPQAIQEFHCDTLPPSDVDIDTMPRAARPYVPRTKARPHAPPGVFLFVAIRHELARLTGKIVDHFQNLASPRRYADVVALDEELEKFRRDLPDIYRMDRAEDGSCTGTDKSFDDVCSYLPLHRYLLNIEYHYVRIALHRPYVLRNSEKYSHSRAAAFESAKTDRMVRHEYRKDVKWEPDRARKVHMGGLYRLFNATMMIGIALLLNPNGPEAEDFLSFLDEFIEHHRNRGTGGGDTDQCTKREVKIIELFRAKARDPTWCATSGAAADRRESAAKQDAADSAAAAVAAASANAASSGGNAAGASAGRGQASTDKGGRNGTPARSASQPSSEDQVNGLQHWINRKGQTNPHSEALSRVFDAGSNGGARAFNIAQFFGNPSAAPLPAGMASVNGNGTGAAGPSSTHSGEGVTPPPFTGLLAQNGLALGAGAMGMGLSGVNMSSATSNETQGDLAQSIFDQLGGLENSLGMLNPTSSEGLNGLGYGTGTDGMQSSVGFDPSVFDLSTFWSTQNGSSAATEASSVNGLGGTAAAMESSPQTPMTSGAVLGATPGVVSGSASINIPASVNAYDGSAGGPNGQGGGSTPSSSAPSFRPVAHPHLRALQAAAANGTLNAQHLQSLGPDALANLAAQGAGSSGDQGQNGAGSTGGVGDWGLLPWGGLIEAIAQSSHGIESVHQSPQPQPQGHGQGQGQGHGQGQGQGHGQAQAQGEKGKAGGSSSAGTTAAAAAKKSPSAAAGTGPGSGTGTATGASKKKGGAASSASSGAPAGAASEKKGPKSEVGQDDAASR